MPRGDLDQNYAKAGYHPGLGIRGAGRRLFWLISSRPISKPELAALCRRRGAEKGLPSALRVLQAGPRASRSNASVLTKVTYRKGGADGGKSYAQGAGTEGFRGRQPRSAPGQRVSWNRRMTKLSSPSSIRARSSVLRSRRRDRGEGGQSRYHRTDHLRLRACDLRGRHEQRVHPYRRTREAVGDRAPQPHEANLFDMSAKYGDVAPEARGRRLLPRRARTGASPDGAIARHSKRGGETDENTGWHMHWAR